jgi:O-antigen/teichoic acid export membrane protein
MAATVFVQSVASGHADILTINKINIIGALIGVLILVPMIYFWGNVGMLIGLSILPVLPSFISVAIAKNKYSYVLSNEWKLDKQDVFRLAKYSLMVIVAATTMPLVQIILRGTIADRLGWEYVGYWQAVLRLSDSYLLFINMILASYFLPKLCELRSFSKQLPYAIETLKYLLVLVFLCCMGIWLFRYHIINLLFAESFLPAADLLTYQLIGDFFKVVSHSLGYIAVANAWFKLSIIGDVVQASLFLLFAWFLLPVYQELGVVIAYAVCYGFYFSLIAFIIFCSFHKTRKEVRNS